MRSSISIVKSTALEILSEPLSLLVLLSALALTVLAPAFHYHQFGDATRMARDAGFSALFVCGSVIAVFCTIRAFRREIESGTLEMALAHPVSRSGFFLAKTLGAFVAYVVFSLVVFGTMLMIVQGAEIGGAIAKRTGDVAKVFGPFLAAGLGIALVPLALGALLNRFAGCRFVLATMMTALSLSVLTVVSVAYLTCHWMVRLAPAAVLIAVMTLMYLSAAAAFAMRLRANAAATAVGAVFALFVPAIGNYYVVDVLSVAGGLTWGYVGLAAAVTAPMISAFLLLGIHFINGRDIQWTT